MVLDAPHEVLLGVTPHTARRDHCYSAPEGSTLLLYTDGLIETRTADLDAGQHRLLHALCAYHDLPLHEFLDAVLTEMLTHPPGDDVAVLAVRFHPEDQPQPPEAASDEAVQNLNPPWRGRSRLA